MWPVYLQNSAPMDGSCFLLHQYSIKFEVLKQKALQGNGILRSRPTLLQDFKQLLWNIDLPIGKMKL